MRDGRFENLHAVLVVRGCKLVLERYYEGEDERWGRSRGRVAFNPDELHDLRSITKSVVGLLYGIALAEGEVPPLDASLLDQFPEYQDLTALVLSLTEESWLLLLLVNVLLLLLGCFMELLAIMVIVVPNMLPLVQTLGIDLTHFGVIVTLNLMIGLITPPIGVVMFTVMDITKIPIDRFTREIWPFLLALILVLMLITYVPAVVLLLPEMFYGS